jgi:hypothetical protein
MTTIQIAGLCFYVVGGIGLISSFFVDLTKPTRPHHFSQAEYKRKLLWGGTSGIFCGLLLFFTKEIFDFMMKVK